MFKSLKSLFIVEEDSSKEVKPEDSIAQDGQKKEENSSDQTTVEKPEPKESISNEPSPSTGQINETILEKLLNVIEKNNIDGFDYLEFKKSLQAMKDMPMDEQTKFRSAFAVGSTMGANIDDLINSVGSYKTILAQENATFLETLKAQIDDKLTNQRNEVEQVRQDIVTKTEEIKRLTEEINKSHEQVNLLEEKIRKDEGKINETRESFVNTYEYLVSQFDGDVEKMNQFLK